MKKVLSLFLAGILAVSLTGCKKSEDNAKTIEKKEMITVKVLNANDEEVEIQVPLNPDKVAVLDYVTLDMMNTWGLDDKIAGAAKGSMPEYLSKFNDNKEIVNLGGLKSPDMEALMSLQPEVIFISGRLKKRYDELSKIAPVVRSDIFYKAGFMESFQGNAIRNAKIFGKDEVVQEQLKSFNERINAIQNVSKGKTAVNAIISGGSLATLGNLSRGMLITTTLGYENKAVDVDSSHGNSSSYELLLKLNPDYVFVMDRDKAIGKDGASPAQQLMDNEIVHQTTAHKNGNIVYLTPSVWYLSEGGIQAMDIMLSDVEKGVFKNN